MFKFNKIKRVNRLFVKENSLHACFKTQQEEIDYLNEKVKEFNLMIPGLNKKIDDLEATFVKMHSEFMQSLREAQIRAQTAEEHVKDLEKRVVYKKRLTKKQILKKKYS